MSSVILNEEIDEDYEPKDDELFEYAKFLGMAFPEDEEFLYIAREGLKAPLPEPWKPCQTKTGDIYFFNFDSGESVWEHPCDTYYKDLFIEAKNKKKTQSKKPPLQESKDRQKKPVLGLPKSVSPLGFDKKRDILTEFIQLEKEIKDNKAQLKEKLESELSAHMRDLNIQRDKEIKAYMDQLDKESKKKVEGLSKDLEELESKERMLFEYKLEEKLEELRKSNEKVVEDEKRKMKDKIDREILLYEKELGSKPGNSLETEKKAFEAEKKLVLRQVDEHKDLYEKQKRANLRLEEDLKEEFRREEEKLKKDLQKKLDEHRRDREFEVQKAMLSARNRKSQITMQEKIKELKDEYKVKEEVEKKNAKREYEQELNDLYKNSENLTPNYEVKELDLEKMYQLDELTNKYKIKKQEELLLIDKDFEKKLYLEKELLEKEFKEKVAGLKDRAEKINYSALEAKLSELNKDLAHAKEKLKTTEGSIQKLRLSNFDLQKRQESLKKKTETQQEHLPDSLKISELREKLQEKDQVIERLRLSAPEKLLKLENEIREIRSLLQSNANKDRPFFTTDEPVPKNKKVERRSESRNREDYKEKFNEEELLIDWRKGEDYSWNLSRDISPVEGRNFAYKRPQVPSRAWVKPRDDLGRFSAF